MTARHRLAHLLLVSALAVTAMAWCLDGPASLTLAPPAVTHLLRSSPPIKAALALGSKLRLPRRDHGLMVSQIVTRDMDRDGDLDAAATTPDGDVLVWHNVGDNRLVRVKPDARPTTGQPVIRAYGQLHDAEWILEDRRLWALAQASASIEQPPVTTFLTPRTTTTPPPTHRSVPVDRGPPVLTSTL